MLNNLDDVSIYLGDSCNFKCSYCDRKYVNSLGSQNMAPFHIPHLVTFFKTQILDKDIELPMISFHGGEPFVFVKMMDKILSALKEQLNYTPKIFIQTNGSKIIDNEWFLDKWADQLLMVSISYDFKHQTLNRTDFDIHKTLDLLSARNIGSQLQYVMPLLEKDVFNIDTVKSIVDIYHKHKVDSIDLIPLRHKRGKDQFEILLPPAEAIVPVMQGFIRLVQMLYVSNVNFAIDGHYDKVDKDYFNDHKQLVLSPDGYIYPEYDFLEYRLEDTRLGSWMNLIEVNRVQSQANGQLVKYDACKSCAAFDICGLKYLFSLFEVEPEKDKCEVFYLSLNTAIQHAMALRKQPTLLHHIGVNSNEHNSRNG